MENNTPTNQIPNIPVVQLEPAKLGLKEKFLNFFSKFRPQSKAIGGFMGVLVLTASLGVGVYLARNIQNTATQAAGMKLSLSTNTSNPKVGDTFKVVVAVDTIGAKIAAADLSVKYDPIKLEAKSITPVGDFLPTVLIPEKLFVNFGRADISLGTLVNANGVTAKSGVGILAEVTFVTKQEGITEISFGAGSRLSAVDQSGDALGEKKTLQVTIGNSGSTAPPSPTPAATATPIASPTPVATTTPTPGPSATITGTKVWTQYAPWHLDIYGTNLVASSKARLFDSNGTQWGADIGLYIPGGSTTASSIALPSNNPPSRCNVGKTCTISVQIVTSTGSLSNKASFTLPAN